MLRSVARLDLNGLVISAMAAVLIAGCSSSGGSAGSAAAVTAKPAASAAPAGSIAPISPAASVAPAASQATAAASDPVCDPWLTPAAIESAMGAPATKITGTLLPNPNPGFPKDVACYWTVPNVGSVQMSVNHDGDDFYVRVKVPGVGGAAVVKVTGVGDLAAFWQDQLFISIGMHPTATIVLSGKKGGQPLDQATLVALGKQIPVPPPAQ